MKSENFIPFSQENLERHLAGRIPDEGTRELFLSFCRMIETLYYLRFHRDLAELKSSYAAFDPDRITGTIPGQPSGSEAGSGRKLLDRIEGLLVSANFREITRERIERAFLSSSPWGLQLKVDLDRYELLSLYCRGEFAESTVKKTLFLEKKFAYDVFRHVVLVFQLKDGDLPASKGNQAGRIRYRSDRIYLKLFKNVPTVDLEMLFPDTRIQIRLFDKMKVILPLVAGAASSLYKIVGYVLGHGNQQPLWTQVGFWTLVGGLFGIALKGFFSYRNTVEKYLRSLTESLYFQNLDNNSGVFKYLLDDAEEEECKELILGYYFLRFEAEKAHGLGSLDERIERYFKEELGSEIDFEVDDSIRKLRELGLLAARGETLEVATLPEAREKLERQLAALALP